MSVAVGLVIAACGGNGSSGADDVSGGGAVTVTDARGVEVSLDAPAERIVCLDGACLDAMFALGLEPVATSQYGMAVNESFWGPDTTITQLGGSFFEPDIEGVIAADPDLIVATRGVHADVAEAVAGSSEAYLQRITGLDEARQFLRDIAVLTDREARAEEAIEAFDAKLDAYAQASPGDRVVVTMYGSDTDFGIDAADSLIGELLAEVTPYPWPEAGEDGYLDFSVERLLQVDPDAIFVQTFAFDPDAAPLSEQLAADPLWSELAAVRNGEVHEVETDWFATGRSLPTLGLILDTVLPTAYPEAIPEPLDPSA